MVCFVGSRTDRWTDGQTTDPTPGGKKQNLESEPWRGLVERAGELIRSSAGRGEQPMAAWCGRCLVKGCRLHGGDSLIEILPPHGDAASRTTVISITRSHRVSFYWQMREINSLAATIRRVLMSKMPNIGASHRTLRRRMRGSRAHFPLLLPRSRQSDAVAIIVVVAVAIPSSQASG